MSSRPGLFNSCESRINEVISPRRCLWSISITINIEWDDIMNIVEDKCPPLIDILSEIPDYRKAKGKRHPLPSILALACVAMMCGYKSYRTFSKWGENYGEELMKALGFTHVKGPCAATFSIIFRRINVRLLEKKIGIWAENLLSKLKGCDNIALDGKTAKGSRKQGSSISHFLSALGHELGLTLAQSGVDSKTNEIGVVHEVLKNLVLEGRVVTMDALLTQRKVAKDILDGGGDYVMIAKENQEKLLDDVKTVFHGPFSHLLEKSYDQTLDSGHGRIEERHLTVSSELSVYSDWPGLQQVFQLHRKTTFKKTGEKREETVYGVTSLTPQEADASCLMGIIRRHWHIENKSHWVRDVVFGEDGSQVHCGNAPQVMAALRNTVIGLIRSAGMNGITDACLKFAAQPRLALELMGIRM
jgi:predicted transposase YbfD/YdcC